MPQRIVVIGASSGGLDALRALLLELPEDFAAPVFIVLHIAPNSPGILAEILGRSSSLPVVAPKDGERIQEKRVYVASPDRHMLIEPGIIRLTRGPKENRFRPAIDPLFRSAAQVYGPGVIGVILTGGLDDGTAGLWAIQQLGGTTIVQDPEDALVPSMPRSALEHVDVDHVLRLNEIPNQLTELVNGSVRSKSQFEVPEEMTIEIKIAKEDFAMEAGVFKLGEPSVFACPECHGVLLKMIEGKRTRFRCHTGHAFSVDSLLVGITEGIGETLWSAIRAMEEGVLLMRHMADHLSEAEDKETARLFREKAEEAQRRADLVRHAVMEHEELSRERVTEEASA